MWSFEELSGTISLSLHDLSEVPRLIEMILIEVLELEPLLPDFIWLFRDSLRSLVLRKLLGFHHVPIWLLV
jgi:hypothetical protein